MTQSELTLVDSLARLRLKTKKSRKSAKAAYDNPHAAQIARTARQSAQTTVSLARDAREINKVVPDVLEHRPKSRATSHPHITTKPDLREDALDAIEETLRNLHAFADWLASASH